MEKIKIKVIFLDFDGPLNVHYPEHDQFGRIFHPKFVKNLKWVIDETGAKIVVSSSWRLDGLDKILEMWKFREYPGEIIDVTPSLRLQKGGCIRFFNGKLERHPTEEVKGYSIPRGCEIEYWLENESKKFGEVESYVVIDDDQDFLYNQRNNYVKCSENFEHPEMEDWGYGLTKECAEQAIIILKNVKPLA